MKLVVHLVRHYIPNFHITQISLLQIMNKNNIIRACIYSVVTL